MRLMLTRTTLAIAATVLAAVAALITQLDGDADFVPYFFGLMALGGIGAWAVREPYTVRRRSLAIVIATAWLGSAVLIGGLLVYYQAVCGCSRPVPPPEATYVGLTAVAYRLIAILLGGALMAVAALSPSLDPRPTTAP
jgi:hypothetical protein